MKCIAGIDAGATKTHCLIADANGNVLGFGSAGTGNYEVAGTQKALGENRRALESALSDAGVARSDLIAAGLGVAGADLPEDFVMLEREVYTPLLGDVPRDFQNDSAAGLRGGTRAPFGIVIACGTGCVCAGKNRSGVSTRVGGFGDEFGDACSGSSIGREGLREVFRARDGIVPPTLMTDLFLQRAGCTDVDGLFLALYRGDIKESKLEPMAPLVFDAAFAGDRAACGILAGGGAYLGAMVNAVARKLDMCSDSFDVVMAGSVFKGSSTVLADSMTDAIRLVCPSAQPVMPAFEPVVGALLMGMELRGPVSDRVYDTLAASLAQLERRHNVRLQAA